VRVAGWLLIVGGAVGFLVLYGLTVRDVWRKSPDRAAFARALMPYRLPRTPYIGGMAMAVLVVMVGSVLVSEA
jgi:hypothetical protein